jgi:hypothetical protein
MIMKIIFLAVLWLGVPLLNGCGGNSQKIVTEPYVKKETSGDAPVALSFAQLLGVTEKILPNTLTMTDVADEHLVQFKAKNLSSDFKKFNAWSSIKVIRSENDPTQWDYFLVEIHDTQSYDIAKLKAFQLCKEVWQHIDDRVPRAIDELAQLLVNYEKQAISAKTSQLRYGYVFDLDASHYHEGYPVVCGIAYDKH